MLDKLIAIRTTPYRLEITSSPTEFSVQSPQADLRVESPPAQVQVHTTQPDLRVDSTAARESMGYYHMLALLQNIMSYTDRQYERGVADIVAAGDRMANIGSGENVFASLAFERMFVDYRDRRFVLTFIPKVPPSIRFTPSDVQIQYRTAAPRVQITANKPIINIRSQRPNIRFTPGSMRLFLRDPGVLDLTV